MIYALDALNERWVNPYYLLLLHANFLRLDEPRDVEFATSLRHDLAALDMETVERLLRLTWREQLTGAWFAGLNRSIQFTSLIGDALLESRTCYAGQGFCFALARFANEDSVQYLRLYLDEYLPRLECEYDQMWALGALRWLDAEHGTDYAHIYLQPNGLWERYIADKRRFGGWDIEEFAARFRKIMQFCRERIDAAD